MANPIAKEVKEEILAKIKGGVPVADLSDQYGISNRTIYAWLKKKALGSVSVLEYNKLRR